MGKSVVVTGANSGIGLVTCLELAGAGWDVIGTARSAVKIDRLHEVAQTKGVTVRSVICDVDDASSCEQAFGEIAAMTGGGPWAVVNNAGFAQSGAVEDVSDALVRAQLETNVVAPIRIARLVLPGMRERGEGRMLFPPRTSTACRPPLVVGRLQFIAPAPQQQRRMMLTALDVVGGDLDQATDRGRIARRRVVWPR